MNKINNLNNYSLLSSTLDKVSTGTTSKDLFSSLYTKESSKDLNTTLNQVKALSIFTSENNSINDLTVFKGQSFTSKLSDTSDNNDNILDIEDLNLDKFEDSFSDTEDNSDNNFLSSNHDNEASSDKQDNNSNDNNEDRCLDDNQLNLDFDNQDNLDPLEIEELDNMPIITDMHKENFVSKKISLLINNMIDSLTMSKIDKAVNDYSKSLSTLTSSLTSIKYLSNELSTLVNNYNLSEQNNYQSNLIYQIYFTYLLTAKELCNLKQNGKEKFNFKDHKKNIERRIKRRQEQEDLEFLIFEEKFMGFD